MKYWMLLLSALTGGLSVFSLAHRLWGFGLAPLMQHFLEYYRALLYPIVGACVAAIRWVADLPGIETVLNWLAILWTAFWNATIGYVLALLLPAAWFDWLSSAYLQIITVLFGMSTQTYRDFAILAFVLTAPALRADEAHVSVVPDVDVIDACQIVAWSIVIALPLLGLLMPLWMLLSLVFSLKFFLSYMFQLGSIIAAAAVFYALNSQL